MIAHLHARGARLVTVGTNGFRTVEFDWRYVCPPKQLPSRIAIVLDEYRGATSPRIAEYTLFSSPGGSKRSGKVRWPLRAAGASDISITAFAGPLRTQVNCAWDVRVRGVP